MRNWGKLLPVQPARYGDIWGRTLFVNILKWRRDICWQFRYVPICPISSRKLVEFCQK